MVQMNKNILITVFIYLMLAFLHLNAAISDQGEPQKGYIVRLGDTYHNYSRGSHVRIGISFKSIQDKMVNVSQEIVVLDRQGVRVWDTRINLQLQPGQEFDVPFMAPVPEAPGSYTLTIPDTSRIEPDHIPSFRFIVIEPHKSQRLSLITVLAPEWEKDLNSFVDQWEIKASSISFGQVVLCGKKTMQRLVDGDNEAEQLIDRALRREMSVIFLDFGPVELKKDTDYRIRLPYDIQVNFVKAPAPELNFIPEKNNAALNYDLPLGDFHSLNGINGISIPPVDMRLKGKGAEVANLATTGKKPFRFPVIELKPKNRRGRIILCQVITEGRLDEKVIPARNRPELPAYDPFAVQFVLNLISASVGDDLLK